MLKLMSGQNSKTSTDIDSKLRFLSRVEREFNAKIESDNDADQKWLSEVKIKRCFSGDTTIKSMFVETPTEQFIFYYDELGRCKEIRKRLK